MNPSSGVAPVTSSPSGTTAPGRVSGRWRRAAWRLRYVLLAAFVLTITLSHHFLETNTKTVFFADSRHYFQTTQALTEVLLESFHGQAAPESTAASRLKELILLDGPVLPGIFAAIFALIGKVPQSPDWPILVIGLSLLHALGAAVLAGINYRITGSTGWSLATGILWGLYPAAIISSGRFMTETAATLSLLSLLGTLSLAPARRGMALLSGVLAVATTLLKPALVPAVALCTALAVWRPGRRFTTGALIAVAALMAIAPWVIYTKAATGRICITTERMPLYNAIIGFDAENDGWQGIGPNERARIYSQSDGTLPIILSHWIANPQACLTLSVKKVSRFYSLPYNDFRHGCFGLDNRWQVPYHWLLLFLSLAGIALYLGGGRGALSASARATGDLCLLAVVGQGAYFLFEASARAGFITLPPLAVFSGYAFWRLSSGSDQRLAIRLSLLVAALAATVAVVLAEPLVDSHPAAERAYRLAAGDRLEKTVDLTRAQTPRRVESALVLVDGDRGLEGAEVRVNGRRLPALKPYYYFDSHGYLNYNVIRELAYSMRVSADDFRQWRAAPLPVDWLALDGPNRIELWQTSGAGVVYADTGAGSRSLLSLSEFSPNKVMHSTRALEGRHVEPVPAARAPSTAFFLPAAGAPAKLEASPRLHVLLVPEQNTSGPATRPAGLSGAARPKFRTKVTHDLFDPLLRDTTSGTIRINRHILKAAGTNACEIAVPELPPSSHVLVRVSGKIRSVGRTGKTGLLVAAVGGGGWQVIPGRLPEGIATSADWRSFVLEDAVPASLLAGGLKYVALGLYPGPWPEVAGYGTDRTSVDAQIKDLTLEVEPCHLGDLRGKAVIVY